MPCLPFAVWVDYNYSYSLCVCFGQIPLTKGLSKEHRLLEPSTYQKHSESVSKALSLEAFPALYFCQFFLVFLSLL